jgi:transcriptional repressor NrdR
LRTGQGATGAAIRRRRECPACSARFTTQERPVGVLLRVRKRDGRWEAFDRDKLLRGLLRAAAKRPVERSQLERLADAIEGEVRRWGGEADAARIGELALDGLVAIDRVAAAMFASVYRAIEDLGAFEAELRKLAEAPVPSDPRASIPAPLDSPSRDEATDRTGRRGAHAER